MNVFAATFLLTTAVGAASSGVDGSADFVDAVRLYEAVQLEEAEQHFNNALAAATTDAERARVQAWIGLVHAQLGDQAGAKSAFEKAVKLDAKVAMPAAAAPEVTALLENARASLPPPTTTTTVPDVPPPAPVEKGVPWLAFGVGGAGAVLALAGGVAFAVGMDTALVEAPKADFNDTARNLRDTGYTEYAVGGALVGVGVVGVVGGAVLFALE